MEKVSVAGNASVSVMRDGKTTAIYPIDISMFNVAVKLPDAAADRRRVVDELEKELSAVISKWIQTHSHT